MLPPTILDGEHYVGQCAAVHPMSICPPVWSLSVNSYFACRYISVLSFNETCHKYSSCDCYLLERFAKPEVIVEGQGHSEAKCQYVSLPCSSIQYNTCPAINFRPSDGIVTVNSVVSRLTCLCVFGC